MSSKKTSRKKREAAVIQKHQEASGDDKKGDGLAPKGSRNLSYAACVVAKDPTLRNLPTDKDSARLYLRRLRGLSS